MAKLELINMVMIQNPGTGEVVVQNRIKSWSGIAFPGGYVENNEAIYDSAVREIKEETGLDIWNLKSCGLMYWFNNKTQDRYFTYFYKTSDFSGKLLSETEEGAVFWTSLEELKKMKFAPNFRDYLPLFLQDKYTEAYCSWNEDKTPDLSLENPWGIIYR